MLAKLEMKLDQKEGMTSQMSSSMHGALMELLSILSILFDFF